MFGLKRTFLIYIDLSFYFVLILSQLLYNKPILLIGIPYGRWGNRLMLYSYIIAWAKKYDCIVMNPSFFEYSKYFNNFRSNILGLVPNKYNLFSNLLQFLHIFFEQSLVRITLRSICLPRVYKVNLEKEYLNTFTINFPKILINNRIILFHGFLLGNRDFNLIVQQRCFISKLFIFSNQLRIKSLNILESINKKRVIGICMRQGDYKEHFDGKYYLTDDQYKNLVSNLKLQYPDYGFFIACEENKIDFLVCNTHISYQNPALNLCTLSYCDLLIGPPSTFMTWAAFYKNIPVCYINKANWNQPVYNFSPTSF